MFDRTITRTTTALGLALGLAACGGDSGTTPQPIYSSLQGLWNAGWVTQYNRTRDNYDGSYSCPGSLTINHDPAKSSFSGFAVVAAPCPPLSFELTGTIDATDAVRITMAGPRPGSGTCPQFPVSPYSGSLVNSTLSLRASASVSCPGALEGNYDFSMLLTARKN